MFVQTRQLPTTSVSGPVNTADRHMAIFTPEGGWSVRGAFFFREKHSTNEALLSDGTSDRFTILNLICCRVSVRVPLVIHNADKLSRFGSLLVLGFVLPGPEVGTNPIRELYDLQPINVSLVVLFNFEKTVPVNSPHVNNTHPSQRGNQTKPRVLSLPTFFHRQYSLSRLVVLINEWSILIVEVKDFRPWYLLEISIPPLVFKFGLAHVCTFVGATTHSDKVRTAFLTPSVRNGW